MTISLPQSLPTFFTSGFNITAEELYARVTEHMGTASVAGWASLGTVIRALKSTPDLRWANPLELKNTVERAFTDMFGTKESAKPKTKVHLAAYRDLRSLTE